MVRDAQAMPQCIAMGAQACHHSFVTEASGDSSFTRDWEAVRANGEVQFAPVDLPPDPAPPDANWLGDLMEWLGAFLQPLGKALALNWDMIKWLLLGAGATVLVLAFWRLVFPMLRKAGNPAPEDASSLAPERAQAEQLLEDADALARQGRFAEAVHLLLMRSVRQIAETRPDLVPPSATARELARLPALPGAARTAFAVIADRVERSLFALRHLSNEDWQAARSAYADFAFGCAALRDGGQG